MRSAPRTALALAAVVAVALLLVLLLGPDEEGRRDVRPSVATGAPTSTGLTLVPPPPPPTAPPSARAQPVEAAHAAPAGANDPRSRPRVVVSGPIRVSRPATAQLAERSSGIRGLVRGPDGAPVPGAEVHVAPFGSASPRWAVKTDAGGRFELPDLEESHLELWVERHPGPPEVRSRVHHLWLAERTTLELEVPLYELRSISIRARLADGGPTGLSQAEVLVDGEPLGRMGSGDGKAPVALPFEVVGRTSLLTGRTLAPAGTREVEVTLEPSRRLYAEVVRPDDRAVTLRLDYGLPGQPLREVHGGGVSRDGGRFYLDVPAGAGRLRATVPGGESRLAAELPIAADATRVRLVLEPEARIAWEGERARLFAAHDGAAPVEIEPNRTLAPGLVELYAVASEAGRAGSATLEVRAGEVHRAGFPLLPAARVRGRLVDPRGRPVATTLTLSGRAFPSDFEGRFQLLAVPPGRWSLGVHPAVADRLELVAARFGAATARLPEQVVEVTGPADVDLGDVVVEMSSN